MIERNKAKQNKTTENKTERERKQKCVIVCAENKKQKKTNVKRKLAENGLKNT